RLFQNFSFWNSYLEFSGKTGLSAGFSKSLSKTNRVLEQAQLFYPNWVAAGHSWFESAVKAEKARYVSSPCQASGSGGWEIRL
ncbi:MAG: hypothetical protein LBT87_04790, partial [Treponema sp.]|nr:hypothetical protein [Treponema sp.]